MSRSSNVRLVYGIYIEKTDNELDEFRSKYVDYGAGEEIDSLETVRWYQETGGYGPESPGVVVGIAFGNSVHGEYGWIEGIKEIDMDEFYKAFEEARNVFNNLGIKDKLFDNLDDDYDKDEYEASAHAVLQFG